MNGKKAKKLRKRIYGNTFSHRERHYAVLTNGQVVDTGRRRVYQALKQVSKHSRPGA